MTGTRDLKCATALFAAAGRDLMTVRSMTADAPIESIGFHLQQAAEMALKAWLAALGETYPLTHNLGTLLGLLSDRGVAVEPFEELADLTPYAVEFRYEAAPDDADGIELDDASALVQALLSEVRCLLGRIRAGLRRTAGAVTAHCMEAPEGGILSWRNPFSNSIVPISASRLTLTGRIICAKTSNPFNPGPSRPRQDAALSLARFGGVWCAPRYRDRNASED